MRWTRILLAIVVLLPGAAASSQVHATYLGDRYSVTFVADTVDPVVTWEGGQTTARRVDAPAGDSEPVYRAELPADVSRYAIEGRSFALPAPPARDATTRIVFVADMGTNENASAIVAAIARADPDMVIVGGDLSYANGNASVWNDWFAMMEPLADQAPIMPVYGNHEDYCEAPDTTLRSCGPDENGWHAHFALPNGNALFYAFEWGPIRFTVLDTEAYIQRDAATDPKDQATFLNASLAKNDSLWDVVAFHRPVRTTNEKEGLDSDRVGAALRPLLDGRADLVLQGHAHAYERSNAENATLYVTSGGGGRSLYANWGPEEPWLATRASEYHFLLIEASPTKLAITALRTDGTTLDSVALERPAPPKPTPTPTTTPAATTPLDTTPTTPATPGQPSTNGTNANATLVESNGTPGPGLLALVLVLALSARRRRERLRP